MKKTYISPLTETLKLPHINLMAGVSGGITTTDENDDSGRARGTNNGYDDEEGDGFGYRRQHNLWD